MPGKTRKHLLFDANALIDYCESDRTALKLISNRIGQIHFVTAILDEVAQLSPSDCAQLDISVFEPDTELFVQAGMKRGALSTNDHLCLLVAKSQGWICVSNDGRLRKECQLEGVPILWGLDPLVELVQNGHLPAGEAAIIVEEMHNASPFFINERIVSLFTRRIGYRL